MRYINPNSKSGIANKFADFIMSKICKKNNNPTFIKVTIFDKFFIINGSTTSKDVLVFDEVKNEFYEKNKTILNYLGFKQINIIDLIRYNFLINYKPSNCFNFYNSDRPIYHESVINQVYNSNFDYEKLEYTDKLVISVFHDLSEVPFDIFFERIYDGISSEFPYGFSLDSGRTELYYCEYISNQLFSQINANKISLNFEDNFESESIEPSIFEIFTDSIYPKEKIKSIINDVFDFNLLRFKNNYLKNYELSDEIDTQLLDKPWLVKDKVSELYII